MRFATIRHGDTLALASSICSGAGPVLQMVKNTSVSSPRHVAR